MPTDETLDQPDESKHGETTESSENQEENTTVDEGLGRLRTAWINHSPKWYARAIPGKGQIVDQLVTLRLEEFQTILAALDREDSELAHRIAELTAQMLQLNRRVVELEEKLADLESGEETSGD